MCDLSHIIQIIFPNEKIQGSEVQRPNHLCQVHKLTTQFQFSFLVEWEQYWTHGDLRLDLLDWETFVGDWLREM